MQREGRRGKGEKDMNSLKERWPQSMACTHHGTQPRGPNACILKIILLTFACDSSILRVTTVVHSYCASGAIGKS